MRRNTKQKQMKTPISSAGPVRLIAVVTHSPEAARIQLAKTQVEQFILNLRKYMLISFGALHSKAL